MKTSEWIWTNYVAMHLFTFQMTTNKSKFLDDDRRPSVIECSWCEVKVQRIKQSFCKLNAYFMCTVTATDLDSVTNSQLTYSVSDNSFSVQTLNNIGYIKTAK